MAVINLPEKSGLSISELAERWGCERNDIKHYIFDQHILFITAYRKYSKGCDTPLINLSSNADIAAEDVSPLPDEFIVNGVSASMAGSDLELNFDSILLDGRPHNIVCSQKITHRLLPPECNIGYRYVPAQLATSSALIAISEVELFEKKHNLTPVLKADKRKKDVTPEWCLCDQPRSQGYSGALYDYMLLHWQAGNIKPTVDTLLSAWQEATPEGVSEVSCKGFRYETVTGHTWADRRNIGETIRRYTAPAKKSK